MTIQKPRWSNTELTWAILWAIAVVVSVFLYKSDLQHYVGITKNACSLGGLTDWLGVVLSPSRWFGLFTIVLTFFGISWLFRKASDRWPQIGHFKTVSLVLVVFLIALLFRVGCK